MSRNLLVGVALCLLSAVAPARAASAWDEVELVEIYSIDFEPAQTNLAMSSSVFVPRTDSCNQTAGRTCESLVGNAVADALRGTFGTDLAIVNSGGLRADLTCPLVDDPGDTCPAYVPPPYTITGGKVTSVLPFANLAVTLGITGLELKAMLENGVSQMPAAAGRFPQVSGFCFTYDIALTPGARIVSAVRQAGNGSCTGAVIDFNNGAVTYSLATFNFVAAGGDGYPDFSGRFVSLERDDVVVADYILANDPIAPALQGRIVCTTSGATACPVTPP
jgi:2',3'-cyclic-nucleotide 2'-phosphodiesterase (5'-nucleotidase family)